MWNTLLYINYISVKLKEEKKLCSRLFQLLLIRNLRVGSLPLVRAENLTARALRLSATPRNLAGKVSYMTSQGQINAPLFSSGHNFIFRYG